MTGDKNNDTGDNVDDTSANTNKGGNPSDKKEKMLMI